jgi:hypothetical protein
MSSNWRAWLALSPKAVTVGRFVVCAATLGAVGACLVGVAALIRDKPLEGVGILVIPAAPVIALGQLWAIGLTNSRLPPRSGGWRERRRAIGAMSWKPRAFFFGNLPANVGRPLLALAFLGWLSGVTAFPTLARGGPAGAGDGCPYQLSNHGIYTCVSQHVYEHAGAAEQRLASGILLGFFAIHIGAALGGLHGRRQAG